jgi:POT family proton-dependent oligopeptide transporter
LASSYGYVSEFKQDLLYFCNWCSRFWAKRKLKGKEASSILKWPLVIIIMGFGFLFMVFAAMEFEIFFKHDMVSFSLFISYHWRTLSFAGGIIIYYKIISSKYASLMMGVYFAATGLGNKVAGIIGEPNDLVNIQCF